MERPKGLLEGLYENKSRGIDCQACHDILKAITEGAAGSWLSTDAKVTGATFFTFCLEVLGEGLMGTRATGEKEKGFWKVVLRNLPDAKGTR